MWLIDELDDFEETYHMLVGAEPVGKLNSMIMKKKQTELCVYYGLYNNDKLIAYFWLMKMPEFEKTLKGFEFHVEEKYQKQGIGFYFYRFIVLDDAQTIITDFSHTRNSSKIWDKLISSHEFKVGTYNAITRAMDYDNPIDREMIYSNDFLHLTVRSKTIRDIGVNSAEEVSIDISFNTAKIFGKINLTSDETFYSSRITPFSFEL